MHLTDLEDDDEEGGDGADNTQLLQQSPEGGLLCIWVIIRSRHSTVVLKARVVPKQKCQDACTTGRVMLFTPSSPQPTFLMEFVVSIVPSFFGWDS